jgi:hypothetical protein
MDGREQGRPTYRSRLRRSGRGSLRRTKDAQI